MPTDSHASTAPDWDALFEIAAAQDGHFTSAQAAQVGYSPQLLHHYVRRGRLARVRHGVYRMVHFPAGENEGLAVVWLWSQREGVFSHETAMAAHRLSDTLPARLHLTLPEAWRKRRLRVPRGVVVHFADITDGDRAWYGSVPVTSPARTLADCADDHVAPDIVGQAISDGLAGGLFVAQDVESALEYVKSFGVGPS